MFYASYNFMNSEVYCFRTKQARDNWVNNPEFFERVPVTRSEVNTLCGRDNIRKKSFDDEAKVYIIENSLR